MRSRENNARKPSNDGFLNIMERYWLVLLGLIIGTPIVLRYLKDADTKGEINNAEEAEKVLVSKASNPVSQLIELNKVTTNTAYHSRARNVAHALGTNELTKDSTFWDLKWMLPSTMTENEESVIIQLKDIKNSGQARLIIECYYVLTRRNLRDDLLKYLSKSELAKIPLFK